MGIVILLVVFFLFEKRIRQNGTRAFYTLNYSLIAFIIFSIILNDYQEYVYLWDYGVPGVDLSGYFNAAHALANGARIRDLERMVYRFSMNLSGVSYIAYAILVEIIAFSPVIISYRLSLHLVYTVQLMVAILAIDNLCRLFPGKKEAYNYPLLYVMVSCVCISQMASGLMRDIWFFYFITLLFHNTFCTRNDKFWAVILVFVCTLLRFYTAILTVPFFAWKYTKNIKWGILASIAITAFFLVGQGFISTFAIWFGIKWKFSFNFDVMAIVRYVLFPNIVNQSHNVQHLVTGYHANFGGNNEWIYYMLACWNSYVYPIAGYGMYCVLMKPKSRQEGLIWLLQIVNIGLLYSVFYDSVSEPRHKLLIIFGLLFFFNEGFKRIPLLFKAFYFTAVTVFLIVLLPIMQ